MREALSKILPLNDEQWDVLSKKIKTVKLAKNEFFLEQGNTCNHVCIVASGALRTFYIDQNLDEVNFLFHLENSFFCDYESFLTGRKSSLNIQALEPCVILLLHKSDMQHLYQSDCYWQQLGRLIAENLYLSARRRVEELLFLSAENRYLNFIADYPATFQRIPQKHIASYLGVKPQSLSRIRKHLVKQAIS